SESFNFAYDSTKWVKNGTISFVPGAPGFFSDSNGGSLISTVPVPAPPTSYEVQTALAMSDPAGTYVHYLRASNDALAGPAASGSFYSVELQNPTFNGNLGTATLAVYKRVGGALTQLATTVVPVAKRELG